MTRFLPTVRAAAVTLVASLGVSAAAPAAAGPWTGNVSAVVGRKLMDKDSWEPADELREAGVLIDFRNHETYPVSVALDFFRAEKSASGNAFTLDARTNELHLGARIVLNDGDQETWFRPYLGAGVSLVEADVDLNREGQPFEEDRAFGAGVWGGAGIYVSPLPGINIGFDARWSTVPVKLLGEDFDAGGIHLGVLVGWRWLAI